jgi:hypothetical protein
MNPLRGSSAVGRGEGRGVGEEEGRGGGGWVGGAQGWTGADGVATYPVLALQGRDSAAGRHTTKPEDWMLAQDVRLCS